MSSIASLLASEVLDSAGQSDRRGELPARERRHGRCDRPLRRFDRLLRGDGAARWRRAFLRQGGARRRRQRRGRDRRRLLGCEALDQRGVDLRLIDLDGTASSPASGRTRSSASRSRSRKAAADEVGLALYRYVGGVDAHVLPVPQMNVLNGGVHADNNVDFQEFMIVPHGAPSFREALRWGAETYHALRGVLHERHLSSAVGDEGGFAPDLAENEEALRVLVEAIERRRAGAGGRDRDRPRPRGERVLSRRALRARGRGTHALSGELAAYWADIVERYPIISIEDGMAEEDWEGWAPADEGVGDRVQLVGDDLFVTNVERLDRGIEAGVANAVLIKVNQIGTLTETLLTMRTASEHAYRSVMSHRSGETEDIDHRRPRRRDQLRADQGRRPCSLRPCGEVQPVAADRGRARGDGDLQRRRGLRPGHGRGAR